MAAVQVNPSGWSTTWLLVTTWQASSRTNPEPAVQESAPWSPRIATTFGITCSIRSASPPLNAAIAEIALTASDLHRVVVAEIVLEEGVAGADQLLGRPSYSSAMRPICAQAEVSSSGVSVSAARSRATASRPCCQ